jgi:hypothetical protein
MSGSFDEQPGSKFIEMRALFLAAGPGLFNSAPTAGEGRGGSDRIGACANGLFMACSALFIGLLGSCSSVLFLR